jgi:hypothetical protein
MGALNMQWAINKGGYYECCFNGLCFELGDYGGGIWALNVLKKPVFKKFNTLESAKQWAENYALNNEES